MATSEQPESVLREAIGCLALLLLFGVCIGAPPFFLQLLGPWAALGASAAAFAAWAYLGPPPHPGLLPGAQGIAVLFNSLVWSAFSLVIIMRAWVNAG